MKFRLLTIIVLFSVIFTYSQENPKIDKKEFLSRTIAAKEVTKNLKAGDEYYNDGLYDAALSYYLKLYAILDSHSPLNYKIGVSCLNGTNPKDALYFLRNADTDVAVDYQLQLGMAYLYRNMYREAKASFNAYLNSLPKKGQKKMTAKINQLFEVCDFSEKAYRDSVPVFIINLGPNVNSYYDDYSPVEYYMNSKPYLYFTTRRPKYDITTYTDPKKFKERIFYSSVLQSGLYSEALPALQFSSNKHHSISGADNQTGLLYFYKGKKRSGDIYSISFKPNGKVDKQKSLKNKYNKIASKETSISFADNGDFYFISNRRGGVGGKDIWFAEKKPTKKGHFRPVNLGKEINTPFDEEGVFVERDGSTLYFSSNGLPGMGGFDIFKSKKLPNGNWGAPINMGYPINSPNDDLFYRPTSNPDIALFSSKRQGGYGELDIHMIKKDHRIPFELTGNVTDVESGKILNASVTLYDKASTLPVGSAQNDTIKGIYSLKMEDGGDFYVQVDAPGYSTLISAFTCPETRHEVVKRDFTLERLLRPYTLKGYVLDLRTTRPVQAEIILKPEGKDAPVYRTVSDINSGFYSITVADKISMDLLVAAPNYFDRVELLSLQNEAGTEMEKNISLVRSIIIYAISGTVKEEDTSKPVKSTINVLKKGEDEIVQAVKSNEETGDYEIFLTAPGPFTFEISAEGYFFLNETVEFPDTTAIIKNFELKKLQKGAAIVVENILFNTGNATLKAESYSELNKLVNLLKENPSVRIEVSGHTDNVGSATVNKNLSKSRAMSVMNYLISQGISSARLEYEGYGFDKPVQPNTTPEGRAANRRVEIKVID